MGLADKMTAIVQAKRNNQTVEYHDVRVKLTPKNRAGEKIIKRAGTNIFLLLKRQTYVHFTSEEGPWMQVAPINDPTKRRWINEREDESFTVDTAP